MPLASGVSSTKSTRVVFFLIKFFNNQQYADEFIRGRVFCNRISRFKDGAPNDATGRVDPNEGTIVWMQPGQVQLQLNGRDMSDDLAGPISVQRDWLNHLHLFCLHAVHNGNLDLENTPNDNLEDLRREMMIPEACFSLGEHAVVVRDVPRFISQMQSAARAKNYRIAKGLVKYYNPESFHGHFRDVESVFWKQAQLSYQREFRFLIDSRIPSDRPLFLEIGDISGITHRLKSTELNGEELIGGELRLARQLPR